MFWLKISCFVTTVTAAKCLNRSSSSSWRTVEQPLHLCSHVFWGLGGFWFCILAMTSSSLSAIYLVLLSTKLPRLSRLADISHRRTEKQNDSSNDSDFNLVPYRDDNMTHTEETCDVTRIPVRFTASSIISSCEVQ